MKKIISVVCGFVMLAMVGCGSDSGAADKKAKNVSDVFASAAESSSAESSSAAESEKAADSSAPQELPKPDVDLSVLNYTMAYSELTNMYNSPDSYKDKTVKITGTFAVTQDNGTTYFACLLSDNTQCCSLPMEFILEGDKVYPQDYPTVNSQITVIGKFGSYYEGDGLYCQLTQAQLV